MQPRKLNLIEDDKTNLLLQPFVIRQSLDTIKESAEENISDDSLEDISKTYITPTFNLDKFLSDKTLSAENNISLSTTPTEVPSPRLKLSIDTDRCTQRNVTVESSIEIDRGINMPSPLNDWKPCISSKEMNESLEEGVRDSIAKFNKIVNETINTHIDVNAFIYKNKKLADLREGISLYNKLEGFKVGILEYKSDTAIASWKRKYCKLECPEFKFFEETGTRMLAGIFDFKRFPIQFSYNIQALTFTITVKISSTNLNHFTFRAKNKSECTEWVNGIAYCIRTYKNEEKRIPSVNYFWQVHYVLNIVPINVSYRV